MPLYRNETIASGRTNTETLEDAIASMPNLKVYWRPDSVILQNNQVQQINDLSGNANHAVYGGDNPRSTTPLL